jgi:uncharacterized protein
MTPTGRPLPPDAGADELDAPFWDACRRHELTVMRCGECERAYWPATACVEHGWAPMRWVPASGTGAVHTYTVIHHAYLPWLAHQIPYPVVVVRLEEGPFFHAGLVGCSLEDLHVGMRVEVTFEDIGHGWVLPYFRPCG